MQTVPSANRSKGRTLTFFTLEWTSEQLAEPRFTPSVRKTPDLGAVLAKLQSWVSLRRAPRPPKTRAARC
jgi:hypothetical protein